MSIGPGEELNLTFSIKPTKTGEIKVGSKSGFLASFQYTELDYEDNDAYKTITVYPVGDLKIELTPSTENPKINETITYSIKITNNGEIPINNITLEIDLPETLEDIENIGDKYIIESINEDSAIDLELKYKIKEYGISNLKLNLSFEGKDTNLTNNYAENTFELIKPVYIESLNVLNSNSNTPIVLIGNLNTKNSKIDILIEDSTGKIIINDTINSKEDKSFLKSYFGINPGTYTLTIKTNNDSKTKTFNIITPQITPSKPIIENKTNITTYLTLNYNENLIYGKLEAENKSINASILINIINENTGFKLNNSLKTNETGEYNLETNLINGNYTIEAIYFGENNYLASNTSIKITINDRKMNTNISAREKVEFTYGNTNKYTGTLTDNNGNALVGFHLALNLTRLSTGANKVYYVTTDYDGNYSLDINLAPGDYLIDVSLNELGYSANFKTNLTILSNTIKTVLNVNDTLINYNNNELFIGKLLTSSNSPISGAHLNLTLSNSRNQSRTYDLVSDYTGVFSLPINLAIGEYKVLTSFAGFNEYESSSSSNTLTVH